MTHEDLDWMDQGMCRQVGTEFFFPEKGETATAAKRVCARCPVRTECLEWALRNDERFGVWGGTSERQRRKLRPRRPAPGPVYLTEKYAGPVADLVRAGLPSVEIARRIGCSRRTVGRIRHNLSTTDERRAAA